MTSINRFITKPELGDADLFPLWDSVSKRTRNITPESIADYVGNKKVTVSSIGYSLDTLTITYTDGEIEQFAIDRPLTGSVTPEGNVNANGSRLYIRQYASGNSSIKETWFNDTPGAFTGWVQTSSFSEAV